MRAEARPALQTESGNWATAAQRLIVVAGAASFVLLFDFAYRALIAPHWTYSGLVDHHASDGSMAIAIALAASPAAFLATTARKPSDVVVWLLYILAYVPASIIPYYTLGTGWSHVQVHVGLFLSFAAVVWMQRIPRKRLSSPVESSGMYAVGLGVVASVGAGLIVAVFGMSFDLPALDEIYDARAEFVSVLAGAGVMSYVVGWTALAAAPMAIAQGLANRTWWLIAVGLGAQLVVYSVTGYRLVLFSGLMVAGLWFVLAKRRATVGSVLIWIIAFGLAAILLLENVTGPGPLSSIFVRRLLAVPGSLFGLYVEFFSHNPPYLLSHSVLDWLIDARYPVPPPQLIAYTYQGNIFSANAGLWADGFANFGYAGMVLAAIPLAALLWLMDSVSVGRALPVAGAAFGATAFNLANSALLTSLMTHGIVLLVVLVWLMPSRARDDDRLGSSADHVIDRPSPAQSLTGERDHGVREG